MSGVSEFDVRQIAVGYRVGEVSRREVFVTAVRTFGQLPGAGFSTRLWFPAWLLGLLVAAAASGALLLTLNLVGGPGGFVAWLAVYPGLIVMSLLLIAVFTMLFPFIHVFVYPLRRNYIAMCDPGKAFLAATFYRRHDGLWVLEAKGFGAVRRGEGLADNMVATLLNRVTDLGGVRVVGRAQTTKLARDYYARRFGFQVLSNRRIVYPPTDDAN